MLNFENIKKQLPDGTWVDRVNQFEQSAEVNLHDMIVGFFSGNLLNKDNLRKIIMDVLEFADTHQGTFCCEKVDDEKELQKEIEEGNDVIKVSISNCCVYLCIAEAIVEELGDLEFARQVFHKCEELAENTEDFSCLADSIKENLHDEKWYDELKTKANSLVKNCADVLANENAFSDN